MRANCNSSVTPLMAKASPARSPARSLRSIERSRRALQPEPALRPPTVLEVVDEHPDREVELPGVGRIDANAAGAADVEQRFVVNGLDQVIRSGSVRGPVDADGNQPLNVQPIGFQSGSDRLP